MTSIRMQMSYDQIFFYIGAYMVGYMIASPIFAHIVRTGNPMKIIALGLFVWALANLATGNE
jgi:hypothetical protein